MTTEYAIGDRIRVIDEQHDDAGRHGVIVAEDDAGRYYVSLDHDPTLPEGKCFHGNQLAAERDWQAA